MLKRVSAIATNRNEIAEPADFSSYDQQVKVLIKVLVDMVAKLKKSNAAASTYYKHLELVVSCSREIEGLVPYSGGSDEGGESSNDEDGATPPLAHLIQSLFHRCDLFARYHTGCVKQSQKLMVLPILNVINTVLKPARVAKKESDKAKHYAQSLDSRLKNYLSREAEKMEPLQLMAMQRDYYTALAKYRVEFDQAYEAVNVARARGVNTMIASITAFFQWRQQQISEMFQTVTGNGDELLRMFNEYRIYMTQKGLDHSQHLLALKEEEEDNRYDKLLSLLSSNKLNVISAVAFCMKGERKDEVLQSLIKTLDAFHRTLPIIRHGIVDEVKLTNDASTLFRTNSMSTKLISAFTKLTGLPFLVRNFSGLVAKICEAPLIYEVDPKKCSEGGNVEDNMQNLYGICEEFIMTILDNVDFVPIPFCFISRCLFDEVELRFPGAGYKAVGGFLFLRFMCPAIITPDAQKVVEFKISNESRRALTLVSKVLQNLSNGIMFGKKETYMQPINPLLEKHASTVLNFFKDVIEDQQADPSKVTYEPLATVHQAKRELLPVLFEAMIEAADTMSKKLVDLHAVDEVLPLAQLLGQLREKQG